MTQASTISRRRAGRTRPRHADRRMLIDGQLVEARADVSPRSTRRPERCSGTRRTARSPTPRPPSPRRGAPSTPATWATDVDLRIRCLEQLHRALVDHRDELAALTIAEVGATAGAEPGRPARPADRRSSATTRELLKTYPLTEDLGNIESRGMQHHRWVEKEAGRRRRGDHRLQLPEPARAGQARARARGRVHRRAQGRTGHAADHARARRADRQPHRHPRRRRQRAQFVGPRRSARC